MSLIKWNGGDDDRQAFVKRLRDLADERDKAVGKRENAPVHKPRLALPAPASLPAVVEKTRQLEPSRPLVRLPAHLREPEIIEPEIWTPPQTRRSSFAPGSLVREDHPPLLLPRWCALEDGEMGVAVYLWRNGLYVYSDSVEVTPAQKRRYSSDDAIPVPAGFRPEQERCAICGKWTPDYAVGAVDCSRCKPVRACFGRTTPDRYFQCRPSCGSEGFLEPTGHDCFALVPGRRRGNFGT